MDKLSPRPTRNNAPIEWLKAGSLIDQLRNNEGSHVGICCDNADEGSNSAVSVMDEWTDWQDRLFYGDGVIDALEKALAARVKS